MGVMREKEREEEICTEEVVGRARVETRKKDVGRRSREERGRACNSFSIRVFFVRKIEFYEKWRSLRPIG